ncbi:MAG: FapA family protein [Bacillota bacterium]
MDYTIDDEPVRESQAAIIGGVVQVKADAGATGALLKTGEGVRLLVNGALIEDSCRVFPGDQVEVNPVEYVEPFRVEVHISTNRMRAKARYTPARRIAHEIIDQDFAPVLLVEGRRREVAEASGSLDELKKALSQQGVKFGLDEKAMRHALAEPGTWQVVAEGLPPREGEHGYVEPLFRGELKPVAYAQEEVRVDFRERYEIEQVSAGDPIALIHPPVPGQHGLAVTGERIEPAAVHPAVIRCGNGAAISSDSRTVKATRKGVPSSKTGREYFFQVDDFYVHHGNIDIKSGNTNFRGHLEIEGDILEGMKVLADGNIIVGGSAAGAAVMAGGSIIFKNQCIKCQVRAGWRDTILQELYSTLDQLCDAVGQALRASVKLARALQEKGKYSERAESVLVRSLLQSKFKDIPELAAKLSARVKGMEHIIAEPVVQTVREVVPLFLDFNYSQTLSRPVLEKVFADLYTLMEDKAEEYGKAGITAPYVQNSSLTCTGDIIITAGGVYSSQFKCGGSVRIARICRGSSIEAGADVQIGEAGSPRLAGDHGLVRVPKDARVCLGRAYESFRVIFGDWEYRCPSLLTNICLSLDLHEGAVKVEPWSK